MTDHPTITICLYRDAKYRDRFGMVHDCFVAEHEVEVTRTEEFVEWEYYSETIKDHVWVDAEGRKYHGHTPTDFGDSTIWTPLFDTAGPRHFWAKRDRYGLLPVVPEEETI